MCDRVCYMRATDRAEPVTTKKAVQEVLHSLVTSMFLASYVMCLVHWAGCYQGLPPPPPGPPPPPMPLLVYDDSDTDVPPLQEL